MKLRSTRNHAQRSSLREAVFTGLAPDGGLYLPEKVPPLSDDLLGPAEGASFQEVSDAAARHFIGDEWPAQTISEIVFDAFTFDVPLRQVDEHLYILELFHGPTFSFKDFGARFMARIMQEWLEGEESEPITVLTATSGDTGSAVAQAFHNTPGIRVVLLYPSGGVSTVQEKQFATLGGNVTAVEVEGRFDDCQRLVKGAFADDGLRRETGLTSANSINIARLIPQMFYYIYARAQLADALTESSAEPVFVVPSGNFGNLTAGVMAHLGGLPVRQFVAATNENDVVPQYLEAGVYEPRASVETYSTAMDVGAPSNFERLRALFEDDVSALRSVMRGIRCSDAQTLEMMQRYDRAKSMIIDPHTAVACYAAEEYRKERGDGAPIIVLSTAHPAKFPETVEKAIGRTPPVPARLEACLAKEKEAVSMRNDPEALRELLLS